MILNLSLHKRLLSVTVQLPNYGFISSDSQYIDITFLLIHWVWISKSLTNECTHFSCHCFTEMVKTKVYDYRFKRYFVHRRGTKEVMLLKNLLKDSSYDWLQCQLHTNFSRLSSLFTWLKDPKYFMTNNNQDVTVIKRESSAEIVDLNTINITIWMVLLEQTTIIIHSL
jgi:hypothetical protein